MTPDRRLQTIFIAFAFGSFLEGTAGFGTPVAITAAMLAGLGFNPIYGAGLCLIANTAPVAFGAIGAPVLTAASVSGMDPNLISQVAARQLPLLAIIIPFWLSIVMCGVRRSMEILPANTRGRRLLCRCAVRVRQLPRSDPARHHVRHRHHRGPARAASLLEAQLHFPLCRGSRHQHRRSGYSGKVVLRAWGPYLILAVMVFLWGLPSSRAS